MFNRFFKPERIRRDVNPNFDSHPSYGHIFYFEATKGFIKDKVVLDVGCWTGQFERLAYKSAKKMVAIDTNPQAISFAKKNLPNVTFLIAGAEKLPFSDSYFDTVYLLGVIEHVPKGSEKKVLKEIYRVLKPKGILILTTDNYEILSILFDPAFFLIGHRHYNMNAMCKMLSDTGFRIKKNNFMVI